MKLSEAYQQLYHGSHQPLKVGKVYRARLWQDKESGMGRDTEKILEFYRPRNAPSRQRAFFLADDSSVISVAGGSDEYVYQVQPVGRVMRTDQGWLGELSHLITEERYSKVGKKRIRPKKAYEKLAEQYWAGDRFPTSEWSLWEYLTPSFRVVKLDYERWI